MGSNEGKPYSKPELDEYGSVESLTQFFGWFKHKKDHSASAPLNSWWDWKKDKWS